MPEVHVVCGESGEYDGFSRWNVAVYADKAAAEAEAERLNALVAEFHKAMRLADPKHYMCDEWIAAYEKRAGDEHFGSDARYSVEAVKCAGAWPERVTGPAADLARVVMDWWAKHKFDVTGEYGEWNVFDSPPEFVVSAAEVLGVSP